MDAMRHAQSRLRPNLSLALVLPGCLLLAACSALVTADSAPQASPATTVGPTPQLAAPEHPKLIPRVKIAEARGWPPGMKPTPGGGLAVTAFAGALSHPRWVHVLPNGDVLVAETNAPKRPKDEEGVKAKVMKKVQARAGAGTPSADRITLLRDADGDGVAEVRSVFLSGLHSPFGMALVGHDFYVANTDAIVRFHYQTGDTSIHGSGTRITELPAGDRNHHWTRNIIASADGARLYATVGSNSNVAEHGMDEEAGRAAIWEVDLTTGDKRLFATGLRNPNGLTWEPHGGQLWTVVNERDELGDDLVPDYLTSVKRGAFYGWPYSYFGPHVDTRVEPPRPDLVASALAPDYALGAHVAPLGLVYSDGAKLPTHLGEGMFIGEHGSWNRDPPSGYKVVFVPFRAGKPTGMPLDVLTGFVNDRGLAYGRPVGVAIDRRGALLVADDVGNVIWRVTAVSLP
ncbi:MAG: L-sorbosone dehydrogenase [Steroidobacteraceae bacterium]|jgi:glucose/arabinose dehydrogenase|nr:L-sorbosone dehydrogenase [Steroidobacteraceae bacterium]